MEIDWENDFKEKRYLEEVEIKVLERTPEHFTGEKPERVWK